VNPSVSLPRVLLHSVSLLTILPLSLSPSLLSLSPQVATAIFVIGLSYASVPLYRLFCQVTGYGGLPQEATSEKLAAMKRAVGDKKAREIVVKFVANTSNDLPWSFDPCQSELRLKVGDTALAFFEAQNESEMPIVGVATYNVNPLKAGLYFNKIQCFCFDEQRLQAGEKVDMPVFFYIDREFEDDPRMEEVDEIILGYTFFPTEYEETGAYVSPDEPIRAATLASPTQVQHITGTSE
jgi:cytochrome c oxidase assembly protein subunit 11